MLKLEANADGVQRTPIFPPLRKPKRPGVYLTHFPNVQRFAFWNGKAWHVQCNTWAQANATASELRFMSAHQSKPWQGIVRH